MAVRPSTHVVELGPAVVVKRFRSWSQGDPARRRNPPGTAVRQAGRLLALLDG